MSQRSIDANALMDVFEREEFQSIQDAATAYQLIDCAPTIDPVQHGRWIPVAERLPEKRGEYLCTYIGLVFVAEYRNGLWNVKSNAMGSALWSVTHWMPLPEPPEKENHDGE